MTTLTLSALGADCRTVFPDSLFCSTWSEDGARFLLLLYRPEARTNGNKRGVLIFQESTSANRCSDWTSEAKDIDGLRKDVQAILDLLAKEYHVRFSAVDLTTVRTPEQLRSILAPYVEIAPDKPQKSKHS